MPYRTEAPELPTRVSRDLWQPPQWLASRPWFRRLFGGRWERWWCGAWPQCFEPVGLGFYERETGYRFFRPVGYHQWVRVDQWNVLNELRLWRADLVALGDVTVEREDW